MVGREVVAPLPRRLEQWSRVRVAEVQWSVKTPRPWLPLRWAKGWRKSPCGLCGPLCCGAAVTIVPVKIFLRLAFREGYLLKSDYKADSENITEVRLQKGRAAWSSKVFDLSALRLPKHYSRPLALKKEKVRDLQYLLDLMPVNKQTYNNIIDACTVGLTKDVLPDEDPDDLDKLLEYE
ncbi:hypothetical protein GWK47_012695 [Chionoecetes opilio]|uniref:Uncharacterized protein n=1 Tax=Chionoecetes opilio TaxID=41210 RepID=A0A8J4Y595_CHIOP|nr:hypothetical protein GWK47_012695 [Chionoecetes opilio]